MFFHFVLQFHASFLLFHNFLPSTTRKKKRVNPTIEIDDSSIPTSYEVRKCWGTIAPWVRSIPGQKVAMASWRAWWVINNRGCQSVLVGNTNKNGVALKLFWLAWYLYIYIYLFIIFLNGHEPKTHIVCICWSLRRCLKRCVVEEFHRSNFIS